MDYIQIGSLYKLNDDETVLARTLSRVREKFHSKTFKVKARSPCGTYCEYVEDYNLECDGYVIPEDPELAIGYICPYRTYLPQFVIVRQSSLNDLLE